MTDTETQIELTIEKKRPKLPTVKKATPAELERIAGHPAAFTVPFGQIRVADNIRADATDIASLAESIRTKGLITPISVREIGVDDDGLPVFVVETGHRRYNALRALKLGRDARVPVHPMTALDAAMRAARQYAENAQRQPLTVIDEASTLHTLTQLHGLKIGDAAELLGIDRNTASRRLSLRLLPEKAQHAVADGAWDVGAAEQVAKLIRMKAPDELVNQLIRDRALRARTAAAVDSLKQRRQSESFTANLRAAGFAVAFDTSLVKAADESLRLKRAELIDGCSTPAAARRLHPDHVETAVNADGKPVLIANPDPMTGELRAFTTIAVENLAAQPDESDTGDRELTYVQRKRAANTLRQIRTADVARWVANDSPLPDSDLLWLSLYLLTARSFAIDLEALAEMIGATVARQDGTDRPDHQATAEQWNAEFDGDQARRALTALVLLHSAHELSFADAGRIDDGAVLTDFARFAMVTADVTAPVDEPTFRRLALSEDES